MLTGSYNRIVKKKSRVLFTGQIDSIVSIIGFVAYTYEAQDISTVREVPVHDYWVTVVPLNSLIVGHCGPLIILSHLPQVRHLVMNPRTLL